MPIMTGSNPKALMGGPEKSEHPEPKQRAGGGGDAMPGKDIPDSYGAGHLECQEKGYSPRRGMAAGICKC